MPITPVNQSKNTITPLNSRKGSYAFWDDSIVTWDDSLFAWDSPFATMINQSKNTITPVNQTKN